MPKALCPCCGSKVGGITRSGAAKGAATLKGSIDDLTQMRSALGPTLSEADDAQLQAILADAQQTYAGYLDHVHERAQPGSTPDIMTLNSRSSSFFASASTLLDTIEAQRR